MVVMLSIRKLELEICTINRVMEPMTKRDVDQCLELIYQYDAVIIKVIGPQP